MTIFLFIRHGQTDAVGRRLTGRQPGVHLTDRGWEQARALAERLSYRHLDRLLCSPMERTRETASAITEATGIEAQSEAALNEVDFGDWSGRTFAEMEPVTLWRRYHEFRSGVRIPGGEMAIEIQARVVALTERIRRDIPEGVVALVAHGDPIRYGVTFYCGIPLDLSLRIDIDPASVSALAIDDRGARALCINATGSLPVF